MDEQLIFKNRAVFRGWLRKNHNRPKGIWLVFGKNQSMETLTAEEALEEALCFGWIDGLIKKVDEEKYIKFFSPRRDKSAWSEKNKRTVLKLIQSGQVMPPGIQAIERAKENGSWDGPERLIVGPNDIQRFGQMLPSFSQKAAANFEKMSPSLRRQFTGFYLEAKQESTRRNRLEKIIGLLEQNKRPM